MLSQVICRRQKIWSSSRVDNKMPAFLSYKASSEHPLIYLRYGHFKKLTILKNDRSLFINVN